MSVLIKGMSFPTKENFMTQLYLICDKDENWYAVDTTNKDLYKLIEVKEPHGDLVDLSDMVRPNNSMRLMTIDEQLKRTCEGWSADRKQYVVIEAEEET